MNKLLLALVILGCFTFVYSAGTGTVELGGTCNDSNLFCKENQGGFCDTDECKSGNLAEDATCDFTQNNAANSCQINHVCVTGLTAKCKLRGDIDDTTTACTPGTTDNKTKMCAPGKHCNATTSLCTEIGTAETGSTCSTMSMVTTGICDGNNTCENKVCVLVPGEIDSDVQCKETSRNKAEKCPLNKYCKVIDQQDPTKSRCSEFGTQVVDKECKDSIDKADLCGHAHECKNSKCVAVVASAAKGVKCSLETRTGSELCVDGHICDPTTLKCILDSTPSAKKDATCKTDEKEDGSLICVAGFECTNEICVAEVKGDKSKAGGSTSGDGTASTSSSSSSNSNIVSFGVIAILGFVAFLI